MSNKIPIEFRDLPEYIQDILWSDETGTINERIFEDFNLSAQQKNISLIFYVKSFLNKLV